LTSDPPSTPAERGEHDDLDTKIMRSSAWATLGYGGTNALSLLTTIVLARLLLPEDFGVVALALALLAVAYIAQESGLGAALIVYRGDLPRAAAAVMVFSPLVALCLYVVFFAAAPIAADFFGEPRLTDVVRVMSVVLLLRGLTVMPMALLQRDLRFGPITAVELSAGVAQATTAIALALAGAGLWSLVGGQLAFSSATVLLAWVFSPIRPAPFDARWATVRELGRYGRHVALANLLNYGNANSEGIIVGRVLGATMLGYYTIAGRLASLPVKVIGNIVGRGVFAALARVRDDPVRFRQIWLDNIERLALLSTPAAIGLALVAEPFVLTVLGDEWRPAIGPLQVLALSALVGTFSATAGEVYQALHRPQLRVLGEFIYLLQIVPALIVGTNWNGIVGAATAVVLVNSVHGLGVIASVVYLLDVRVSQLAHAILRPALGWVLMTASMLALGTALDDRSAAFSLVALVGVGAAVYVLIVALFARDIVVTMWVNLRGARS
jgi:PST family polysaccharide transporter